MNGPEVILGDGSQMPSDSITLKRKTSTPRNIISPPLSHHAAHYRSSARSVRFQGDGWRCLGCVILALDDLLRERRKRGLQTRVVVCFRRGWRWSHCVPSETLHICVVTSNCERKCLSGSQVPTAIEIVRNGCESHYNDQKKVSRSQ